MLFPRPVDQGIESPRPLVALDLLVPGSLGELRHQDPGRGTTSSAESCWIAAVISSTVLIGSSHSRGRTTRFPAYHRFAPRQPNPRPGTPTDA